MTLAATPTAAPHRTARLLVTAQFTLLAVVALLPRRADWPTPPGVRALGHAGAVAGATVAVVAGTSLGDGLSALPLPNQRTVLRTDGLYRYVRHPVYSGLLLAATARILTRGNREGAAVLVALTALLHVKARFEEQHLLVRFPEYGRYAATTPRFVPACTRDRPLPAPPT